MVFAPLIPLLRIFEISFFRNVDHVEAKRMSLNFKNRQVRTGNLRGVLNNPPATKSCRPARTWLRRSKKTRKLQVWVMSVKFLSQTARVVDTLETFWRCALLLSSVRTRQ